MLGELLQEIMPLVPKTKRETVARHLFLAFEAEDCDTLDECRGIDPYFDAVLDEAYPQDDLE